MHAADAEREAVSRANELYWTSDQSVNHIAEQMDLSKGAFYAMIHPEAAGFVCPDCGAGAVYGNRTAKARGDAECAQCGWTGDGRDAQSYGGDASVTLPSFEDEDAQDGTSPVATPQAPGRSRIMLGGALLGAATGLALVFWARRR